MAGLDSFNAFRRQVESSKFEDHAETIERALAQKAPANGWQGDAAPDCRKEFERMREFLGNHYEQTSAVHSFVDEGGRIVDCIPFDQQPSVREARKSGFDVARTAPPPLPRDRAVSRGIGEGDPRPIEPMVPPLAKGLKDAGGNQIIAPPGTVPVRRITVERLASHGRLGDYFKKGPPCTRLITPVVGNTGIGTPSPFIGPTWTGRIHPSTCRHSEPEP